MNLAVGFFDGVHLGHRRILAQADVALTFVNHPATVFAPARTPKLLMTPPLRQQAVAAALRGGRGCVRLLDFTPDFAALTPRQFIDFLWREYPELETVYCGPNWTFGAKGAGTPELLRSSGFNVEVVPFAEVAGTPVSSTRVRQAIAAGAWDEVRACLGRPWRVEGAVVSGKGLGRSLGFPTLNIAVDDALVRPPCGVYAVATPYGPAVANWGLAPTLGERAWSKQTLEVHLIEAHVDEAPARCTVDVCAFLRPERNFPSLAALQAQVAEDIRQAGARVADLRFNT